MRVRHSLISTRNQQPNVKISIIAAFFFLVLSYRELEGQGLYYDELHQATSSFVYVGKELFQFAHSTYRNISTMNMSHSGEVAVDLQVANKSIYFLHKVKETSLERQIGTIIME